VKSTPVYAVLLKPVLNYNSRKRRLPFINYLKLGIVPLFATSYWIYQACLFIIISWRFANCYRLTTMTLLGRNEFDAAMKVLVVVAIYKGENPFADLVW